MVLYVLVHLVTAWPSPNMPVLEQQFYSPQAAQHHSTHLVVQKESLFSVAE